MRGLVPLIPLLLQALLVSAAETGAEDPQVVRPIELGTAVAAPGVVLVRFYGGGLLDRRAEGLAVLDGEQRPLAFRLVAHDPDAQTAIAVDLRQSAGPAWVHYQARPHPAAKVDPQLPISLVLRTFDARSAPAQEAGALLRWLATATPQGVALVDRISIAHNPFGPAERFITDIEGLLRIEKAQRLRLFSVHDDAALVLLDDRLVLEGRQPHMVTDSVALGREAVEVELAPGVHRVRYVHRQIEGLSMAVLGCMQGPLAQPLPASWFVHDREVRLGPARSDADRPAVGFDARMLDRLAHGGHLFTRFRLTPIAAAPDGAVYRWSLGDGATREQAGSDPLEHVYVSLAGREPEPGGWPLVLELVGGPDRVLGRARALLRPVNESDIDSSDNVALRLDYVRALAGAAYEKSAPEVLAALFELAELTEQPALMAPVTEPFVRRFGERGGPLVLRMAYALATHLARDEPQRALELFGRIAADRGPGAARRAQDGSTASDGSWRSTCAAAELLELLIFRLRQDAEVPARVSRLVGGRTPRQVALLKAKLGDMFRFRGDVEKAADAYREAQRVASRQLEPRRAAVLESAYRETALSNLQQHRYPALRDVLFQWQADFPAAMLGGDLPLLAGRYFQAVGDDPRAVVEFQTILKLNPLHPARPEILFRLAESLDRLGRREEAAGLRAELQREYPRSPFAGSG